MLRHSNWSKSFTFAIPDTVSWHNESSFISCRFGDTLFGSEDSTTLKVEIERLSANDDFCTFDDEGDW